MQGPGSKWRHVDGRTGHDGARMPRTGCVLVRTWRWGAMHAAEARPLQANLLCPPRRARPEVGENAKADVADKLRRHSSATTVVALISPHSTLGWTETLVGWFPLACPRWMPASHAQRLARWLRGFQCSSRWARLRKIKSQDLMVGPTATARTHTGLLV